MKSRLSGFNLGATDWGLAGIGVRREVANVAMRIPAMILPEDVPVKGNYVLCFKKLIMPPILTIVIMCIAKNIHEIVLIHNDI